MPLRELSLSPKTVVVPLNTELHTEHHCIVQPHKNHYEAIGTLLQELENSGLMITVGTPTSRLRADTGIVGDSLEIHITCGEDSAKNFGATLYIHDDNTVELQFTPWEYLSELGYSRRHIGNIIMCTSVMLGYAKHHNIDVLKIGFGNFDQQIDVRSVLYDLAQTYYPECVFSCEQDTGRLDVIFQSQFNQWVKDVNEGRVPYRFIVSPTAELHLFERAMNRCSRLELVSEDPSSCFQRLEVKGDRVLIYTHTEILGEPHPAVFIVPVARLKMYDFIGVTESTTLNDLHELVAKYLKDNENVIL